MPDSKAPDYKAMYYHMAGRMATAIDALEETAGALVVITEKLKLAQQATEDMFMNCADEDSDDEPLEAEYTVFPTAHPR